jgi:hypothetical protein
MAPSTSPPLVHPLAIHSWQHPPLFSLFSINSPLPLPLILFFIFVTIHLHLLPLQYFGEISTTQEHKEEHKKSWSNIKNNKQEQLQHQPKIDHRIRLGECYSRSIICDLTSLKFDRSPHESTMWISLTNQGLSLYS